MPDRPGALPGEPQLRAFAGVAAQLLAERLPRAPGAQGLTRRAGVGLQHLDHRDYVPGDEVRHIDWRQSARAQRPIMRQFEAESVSDWHLVLDASSSMAALDAAHWQAARCMAAGLAYALLQAGHRVGLVVVGARVLAQCPRGRGQHHYAALARLLASLQPAPRGERTELGACGRHLHGASSVFVLSDFLSDGGVQRDLTALLQQGAALHAVQLRSADETRLALRGELDLLDMETGQRRPAWVDEAALAGAAGERQAQAERLRAFCARSGIAFTDWDTAHAWQRTLLDHLLRARRHL
ncbi:hypothetical protein BurJ1DRAFT_1471 [Burkholderiales bacterium JOSHI_001]|nr:hypothetical protein BurJ1DRAFT_1471 [Burkholderiales bacterium JOSHI_001]